MTLVEKYLIRCLIFIFGIIIFLCSQGYHKCNPPSNATTLSKLTADFAEQTNQKLLAPNCMAGDRRCVHKQSPKNKVRKSETIPMQKQLVYHHKNTRFLLSNLELEHNLIRKEHTIITKKKIRFGSIISLEYPMIRMDSVEDVSYHNVYRRIRKMTRNSKISGTLSSRWIPSILWMHD